MSWCLTDNACKWLIMYIEEKGEYKDTECLIDKLLPMFLPCTLLHGNGIALLLPNQPASYPMKWNDKIRPLVMCVHACAACWACKCTTMEYPIWWNWLRGTTEHNHISMLCLVPSIYFDAGLSKTHVNQEKWHGTKKPMNSLLMMKNPSCHWAQNPLSHRKLQECKELRGCFSPIRSNSKTQNASHQVQTPLWTKSTVSPSLYPPPFQTITPTFPWPTKRR